MRERESSPSIAFSGSGIGFTVWLVFFILKLCNLNNPDFAWLTWFWVFFPLWVPIALSLLLFIIICIIVYIRDTSLYR